MMIVEAAPRHRTMGRSVKNQRTRRPAPSRPGLGAVAYRGTGVAVSRTAHRVRPVSVAATAVLAGLAALITIWLGLMGLARATDGSSTPVPEQLAVVRVQQGESLQGVATRVAPDAPVGHVVERIKELNGLDSAALDAGQTLIAPIG